MLAAINSTRFLPFVLYSLRHTFLTRLGESGCDVWTLARIAGHSSIAISSRYVHPSVSLVLDAMERMGGHKTGHSDEKEVLNSPEGSTASTTVVEDYLVSADGLEPSTHALKEQQKRRLPRIFNNIRSRESLNIGVEGWWSGLNRHTNKHSPRYRGQSRPCGTTTTPRVHSLTQQPSPPNRRPFLTFSSSGLQIRAMPATLPMTAR
jgi:hypothetical protein